MPLHLQRIDATAPVDLAELPRPVKESDAKLMANSLQTIETWLNRHAFIAGPQLTIADISAYCEFDQVCVRRLNEAAGRRLTAAMPAATGRPRQYMAN